MIVPSSHTAAKPRPGSLERACFVTLWTTGPDPALDGILRISALRRGLEAGEWETFDRFCNPFAEGEDGEARAASARVEREFLVSRAELEQHPVAAEVWEEFRDFLGGGSVIAPDAESIESWFAHLSGSRDALPLCIGLAEVAGLFLPGRLALRRADLVALLTTADARAHGPNDLRSALNELVRRIHAQDEDVLRIAALGYTRVWRGLAESDARAASRLQLALALLDRPSLYCHETELGGLKDGCIVALARDEATPDTCIDDLEPRCALDRRQWSSIDTMPSDTNVAKPFAPADMETLDAIFQVHLPASFVRPRESEVRATYRPSQHQVAREVARSLGTGELLLMHAPTGTGKTLAYLVPAMLWARRHGVRVGVATYTRALQEQALDREVPRALALLSAAGVSTGTRVCVLKGRDNYVCWRALKASVPDEDTPEAWFSWTVLTLFALTDTDGDLDRLPLRPPLVLETSEPFVRALQTLVRGVRGQTACCTRKEDRDTCAAEVARKRAEKSHVVIINQAFALARQEFFRHVVFDECEHLHEQAHSAFSRTIGFRDIRVVLSRMRQPGRLRSRAVLDRLARMLIEDTPSGESLASAVEGFGLFRAAVDRLELSIKVFEEWRDEARKSRVDREEHSMLREYVLDHDSEELVAARVDAFATGNGLDARLAELVERIDQLPLRNVGSTRRAFDSARFELHEILEVLQAWIPVEEGKPCFRPRTFYDIERDVRGDTVLAARVLLPNEFLGRNYYPELKSGIFLSATTWLQDGFGASRAYLGLDRAAEPAPDEERQPCVVRTFRAPDVFDYRRVLVAIPRDAPAVGSDKDKFLDYVRRFVGFLGERTRGRMLVLFTNSQDTKRVGEETAGFFRARRIPLWFQNMEGSVKEELSDLFRATTDSVLFGVDTFWYGADYPGETLEYVVIVRLPYGVPDRYHHAQCAAIGTGEQRRQIYLPRALAKFRQGFGRLMRRETDKGCVFVLDGRILDPRHRFFLRELPIERAFDAGTTNAPETSGARLVRGDTDHCVHEALAHMNLLADVKRRGLDWSFHSKGRPLRATPGDETAQVDVPRPAPPQQRLRREPPPEPFEVSPEDLPF